ncbi:hypothetical protein JOE44_001980 [Chryseobacterium sp. PvR013]|uniref:hypothetical protein n=1 Tax=Chryseobacterium sp. PvR013 TaxID=2806595 RepID=UPI001AE20ECC|nr:hypothetical protein [Chryseobacterium sp. PvR013]MBP1165096.1 hypothetical protein [Chryseobacterium sp. PvR013]
MEKSQLLFPDKKSLQKEYLLKYRDQFLKLNNLKVGDEITLDFTCNNLIGKQIYLTSKITTGILKLDENGFLYAESSHNMPFYRQMDNGLSGRSKRSWFQRTDTKSKKYFGDGFIIK